MEAAVLSISLLVLVFGDYILLRKKNIMPEKGKFLIKELRPCGWQQSVSFILIPVSLVIVLVMLAGFYETRIIYTLKRLCLIAVLWPIAISDHQEMKIPNYMLLYGLTLRGFLLLIEIFFYRDDLLLNIINEGIAVAGCTFICIMCAIIARGSLGMGDIKLTMLMATFLGVEGVCYSLFVSVVFSFVFALSLIIVKKKNRKDLIPFAPFILAGTFVSIVLTGM